MNHHRFFSLLLIFLGIFLIQAPKTQAQSSCSQVIFKIDSTMAVDETAVCEAAQSWADKDIQLFVYLTDAAPANEADWVNLLDMAEAEAGLRSLGVVDEFERNALAFEASTAAPWATTLTFGENLFETKLDNDAAILEIEDALRRGIEQGDATSGFTEAIATSYTITYPGTSPWVIGLVVAGGAVLAVLILYPLVIRPALERRKRENELRAHKDQIQQNVANLLLACEQLLEGKTPEESVLFQLFSAYGGQHYAEREKQVREWIRRSQAALQDAFDLRQSLISEDVQKEQPLEQQVHNWEMIYLTLSGSSPRILTLSNSELQDLLNPLIILERDPEETALAKQLDDIRLQIAGMPLKVELQAVDPAEVDREGILGNIDLVEGQISELMSAQQEAPGLLEQAAQDRLSAEEGADKARPFGLTGSQISAGMKIRLEQAEEDLKNGLALNVVASAQAIQRDSEIVEDLIAAAADHLKRLEKLKTIAAAGYQPPDLAREQVEIEGNIQQIIAHFSGGDYLQGDEWIDELDADGDRTLAHAESWRERHLFNEESLAFMAERLATVKGKLADEGQPAWEMMQIYPAGNWQDIVDGLPAIQERVQAVEKVQIPEITELNSLEVQDIPQAEKRLATTGKDLVLAERQLQALISRLDEIRTAEDNLPEGLKLARAEWQETAAFRDSEDVKIGPEIDQLIAEALAKLDDAQEAASQREFIRGMTATLSGRQLISSAHAQAKQQVERINQLQEELQEISKQAERDVNRANLLDQNISPPAQTEKSNQLIDAANNHLSSARQVEAGTLSQQDHALAQALETVITAFKAASQLAIEAAQQLEAEAEAYKRLRQEVDSSIRMAERAINAAAASVNNPDACGAGRPALERAQRNLPSSSGLSRASLESLQKTRDDAREAEAYAREAERKARETINHTRTARAMSMAAMFAGGSRSGSRSAPRNWSSGSSRPRVSNRSMSRPTSRPSSSSRRSSSMGSSRRSSSMGSSRRSSSRGGSRR